MALKPEFFAGEIVVKKVVLAVHVPYGGGRAVHENRPSHGIAFCTSGGYRYTFSDGNVLDCRQGDCIYLPKDSSYRVALLADAERPSGLKEAEKSVYAINFLTWRTVVALHASLHRKTPAEQRRCLPQQTGAGRKKAKATPRRCLLTCISCWRC